MTISNISVLPLSYDDKEYIIQSYKPKAYREYTLDGASLFVYDFHRKHCLDIENNNLLTDENLQRFAYPEILFFVLPFVNIFVHKHHDVYFWILDLSICTFQDSFSYRLSPFLFCAFFPVPDFCDTKLYNLPYSCTVLNLTDSREEEGTISSFAFQSLYDGGVE